MYNRFKKATTSYLFSEIRVGFNPETYTVNEADGSVTLNVEVLEGTLEGSVTVLLQTAPGTATEAGLYDFPTLGGAYYM